MGFLSTFALELIHGIPAEAKVVAIQEVIDEELLESKEEGQ